MVIIIIKSQLLPFSPSLLNLRDDREGACSIFVPATTDVKVWVSFLFTSTLLQGHAEFNIVGFNEVSVSSIKATGSCIL